MLQNSSLSNNICLVKFGLMYHLALFVQRSIKLLESSYFPKCATEDIVILGFNIIQDALKIPYLNANLFIKYILVS